MALTVTVVVLIFTRDQTGEHRIAVAKSKVPTIEARYRREARNDSRGDLVRSIRGVIVESSAMTLNRKT